MHMSMRGSKGIFWLFSNKWNILLSSHCLYKVHAICCFLIVDEESTKQVYTIKREDLYFFFHFFLSKANDNKYSFGTPVCHVSSIQIWGHRLFMWWKADRPGFKSLPTDYSSLCGLMQLYTCSASFSAKHKCVSPKKTCSWRIKSVTWNLQVPASPHTSTARTLILVSQKGRTISV